MPLAHILAPQLVRKTAEIEQALGPVTGYLQASPNVDTRSGRSPNAVEPMQPPKMKKGETASAAAQREAREDAARPANDPKRSWRTVPETVRSAAIAKAMQNEKDARMKQLIPLTPAAPQPTPSGRGFLGVAPGQVIGMTESGVPITAPAQPQSGRVVLSAADLNAPGAIVSESGQAVNRKGKKTGYLAPRDPNMRFPTADPTNPYETGGAKMIERFPHGAPVIERRYRSHLEAMQNNRDEQGMPTDKLPKGYFEALGRERGKPYSKDEQKDILNGIDALRQIEKGVSI